MIIYGWGHQTKKYLGPVDTYHCNNCNNDRSWILMKITTWFTLFFIPIIPYSTRKLLLCPICQSGYELATEKFNELKPIAQLNLAFVNDKITQEEYQQKIGQLTQAQIGVTEDTTN